MVFHLGGCTREGAEIRPQTGWMPPRPQDRWPVTELCWGPQFPPRENRDNCSVPVCQCSRQINEAPKMSSLQPVTLLGKRDVTQVTKGRALKEEDYPGLFGWTQGNDEAP